MQYRLASMYSEVSRFQRPLSLRVADEKTNKNGHHILMVGADNGTNKIKIFDPASEIKQLGGVQLRWIDYDTFKNGKDKYLEYRIYTHTFWCDGEVW